MVAQKKAAWGTVASPGLLLPAGSGGEQVEDGGSEGKDKATCVAASDVKEEKKDAAARYRTSVSEEREKGWTGEGECRGG